MDKFSQAADITKTTSGEISDGRRFLEAIKNGNEKDARSLLDKQARSNGFIPAARYHGTFSNDVFTAFKDDGAALISPEKKETAATIRESSNENERRFSPITAVSNDIITQDDAESNNN